MPHLPRGHRELQQPKSYGSLQKTDNVASMQQAARLPLGVPDELDTDQRGVSALQREYYQKQQKVR